MVLFSCYLASALPSVRVHSLSPNPPVSTLGMPLEVEYADDVDFLDEERRPLDQLQLVAMKELKRRNLFMNESKTEFSYIFLAETYDYKLRLPHPIFTYPVDGKKELVFQLCQWYCRFSMIKNWDII